MVTYGHEGGDGLKCYSLNLKDWNSNKIDDGKIYFWMQRKVKVNRKKEYKLDEKHEISLAGSFLKFSSRNSSGGIARQTVSKDEL